MKRLICALSLIVVVLLSACAAADELSGECEDGYMLNYQNECVLDSDPTVSIKSSLTFNWDTMTFTDVVEYDIFFGSGSSSTDYLILRGETIEDELSDQQAGAYYDTLLILDEIEVELEFSYKLIDQTTVSEVYTYASTASIEVSTADVLTYNTIKSEVTSIKSTGTRYQSISKYDYVEQRLQLLLTQEDRDALDFLQDTMTDLYIHKEIIVSLDTITYQDLLDLLEDELEYIPPDDEAVLLERGVEIIQALHDSK
jgi:hypothetical protein